VENPAKPALKAFIWVKTGTVTRFTTSEPVGALIVLDEDIPLNSGQRRDYNRLVEGTLVYPLFGATQPVQVIDRARITRLKQELEESIGYCENFPCHPASL